VVEAAPKRKLEHGSQQAQGEVLEIQLEELLRGAFPLDQIEAVPKGMNGADIVHGWKKSVKLKDLREAQRAVYVDNLHRAAAASDWQEVERLCDEECKIVLSENWEL
jgi:Uncharacterized protein conserved in bacteria (DUF2130)